MLLRIVIGLAFDLWHDSICKITMDDCMTGVFCESMCSSCVFRQFRSTCFRRIEPLGCPLLRPLFTLAGTSAKQAGEPAGSSGSPSAAIRNTFPRCSPLSYILPLPTGKKVDLMTRLIKHYFPDHSPEQVEAMLSLNNLMQDLVLGRPGVTRTVQGFRCPFDTMMACGRVPRLRHRCECFRVNVRLHSWRYVRLSGSRYAGVVLARH